MDSGDDVSETREESWVSDWEIGLPSGKDLTPLSQSLVPLKLAAAFIIPPEPARTILDVHSASQTTVSSIQRSSSAASDAIKSFPSFPSDDPAVLEPDDPAAGSPRKVRRSDLEDPTDDVSAPNPKRTRLVWTPRLHKRFVDVVAHLGIKSAVPKTIMQLMNVEGLTRENVASHLQKYRLYLKRMQGLSNEEPSSSDHLFATTPVPQSLQDPTVPVPYAVPTVIPMPVFGMAQNGQGSPAGMVGVNGYQGSPGFHGFESYHQFGVFRDGNKLGSIVSNHHDTRVDK